MDNTVDFNQSWQSYVDGFGYLNGNYWIGLEALHSLTKETKNIRFYIQSFINDGNIGVAYYDTFAIGNSSTKYILTINGYSGNVKDSMWNSDGCKFSTSDHDNDNTTVRNCGLEYGGGWWFNDCHKGFLNGKYSLTGSCSYGVGIVWSAWKGQQYSYKHVIMSIK